LNPDARPFFPKYSWLEADWDSFIHFDTGAAHSCIPGVSDDVFLGNRMATLESNALEGVEVERDKVPMVSAPSLAMTKLDLTGMGPTKRRFDSSVECQKAEYLPPTNVASVGCESQAGVEESEPSDGFEEYMPENSEVIDTAMTWRLLPASMQNTPEDIVELAYKDTHCEVVREVARRRQLSAASNKFPVVVAFASQTLYEQWCRRQLGKIPRTAQSVQAIIELLSDDVERAIDRLSDTAMESIAYHMRTSPER
jgi:hypothetical protein